MYNNINFLGLQGIELDNFVEDEKNISISVHTKVSPQRCHCCGSLLLPFTVTELRKLKTCLCAVRTLPSFLKNEDIFVKTAIKLSLKNILFYLNITALQTECI